MKKEYIPFFLIVILFSLGSFVSGQISISSPEEVYSLGDTIFTTVTITPDSVEGNFEIQIICDNESEVFYKISPAESAFTIGQETKINHKIILEEQYIGNLIGDCFIKASLGNAVSSSEKFVISSDISLTLDTDKEFYDPGETIVLSVDAVKANGQRLEGFVSGSGLFEFEKEISLGKVTETFVTSKNLEAGEYTLQIFVYEEDRFGEIINYKNSSVYFTINQIPFSVPITLPSLEVNPGEEFEFQVDLFDQSGIFMSGPINVKFTSPNNEVISRFVDSGNKGSILLETNATYGVWVLSSSFESLVEERDITVNKVPKLSFEFLDNSSVLSIKNVGNDVFTGPVFVNIGNESLNLTLSILPGEERKFTLSAPSGEYDVAISGGDQTVEKRLLLTGRVIDIRDYANFNVFSQYPFVWSLLVALLLLLLIVSFFKYNKKNFRLKERFDKLTSKVEKKDSDKSFISTNPGESNLAEASLVLKGTKEPSTIVAIKLKNEVKPFMLENLKKIIVDLNSYHAAVEYKQGEVLLIFSPRKTKSFKNEYNAIKVSFEISKALEEYNRKFKDKIEFGIGLNSGDLVSAVEGNVLKYTGVDNTLLVAKKISDASDKEVIVSEKVKNKLLREVRTEKIEKNGNTYYKVIRISERENNQEKLKDLLKRTHLKDQ